ncbi:MAG: hypothetical protein HYX74_02135 [Acidobacteria bacterium]|nr:hypothetical protein [Acidobacteriota bacterium]
MIKRVFLLSAILSLALGFGLFAQKKAAAAQTLEGTLVDLKCYAAGGFTGNEHMGVSDCGTQCAKSGIPVGLLDAKGGYNTILGPAPALAAHIGQGARITGKVDAKARTLIPDKVEVKKGSAWEEVKLQTMM